MQSSAQDILTGRDCQPKFWVDNNAPEELLTTPLEIFTNAHGRGETTEVFAGAIITSGERYWVAEDAQIADFAIEDEENEGRSPSCENWR